MDFPLPAGPGYIATINEDGLSKLSLSGTVVGQGTAQLVDGSWFYRPFDPAGFMFSIQSKEVVDTPNGAVVTHVHAHAKVVYTYTVLGNDIHVEAHVTNTGTAPLQPGFKSMQFPLPWSGGSSFGLGFNQDHTQDQGEKLSYPSSNVPLAAAFIATSINGSPLNVATWSEEDPHEKFMTLLVAPAYSLVGIFFPRVPPGGCRIYKYAYRFVSSSSDWKVLLGAYKTHLRSALPTIAYEPDARPLAFFQSIDQSYIRPDNPYGYNDGGDGITRRFDKLAGCQDYVTKLTGPMSVTGYQGIIMWQMQGIHPRGIQYRPDFNSFPSGTLPNLPTLTNGFNSADLKIGLQARPAIAATSGGDWDHDLAIRLTDYFGTTDDISFRYGWANANGFKGFYLDSFVDFFEDHGILKAIRDKVGLEHTFCENSTALSLAYSAAYEEATWGANGLVFRQQLQYLRWLWPEAIVALRFREPLGPGGYQELYEAMFAAKLTPLVEDYRIWTNVNNENAILQPLVAAYIGPDGRWL